MSTERQRFGLTAITIENFKGIGQAVTVPLKPLTLLFGANSAGKSTVIQAIQYAWEVLEHGRADVDRTKLGGDVIDLGGFRNLVHGHDLSRVIRIGLKISGPVLDMAGSWHLLPEMDELSKSTSLGPTEPEQVDVSVYYQPQEADVIVSAGWSQMTNSVEVLGYEIHLDGIPLGLIRRGSGRFSELLVNSYHPFLGGESRPDYGFITEIVEAINYAHDQDFDVPDADDLLALSRPEEFANGVWSSEGGTGVYRISAIPSWTTGISFHDDRAPKLYTRMVSETESVLSQLLVSPGLAALQELRGLRYIGPLRQVPERTHAAPLNPGPERWATGLGAWDTLSKPSADGGGCGHLVQACSAYINDTLGLEYTLRRENRIQLAEESDLYARLKLMAAQFEDAEPEDMGGLMERIDALPRIPVLQLRDERNDIDVDPMDIGVGVSQTLPVVVGAVDPNCSIYAVEQPELHIHPAVQVNLGDIFLRELLEEGKKPRVFLLETHSEHLVLRIMRRMRQTFDNELPPDFPAVRPEDVAVLCVEPSETGTRIIEVPVTEDGEFAQPWPHGFFPERAEELM